MLAWTQCSKLVLNMQLMALPLLTKHRGGSRWPLTYIPQRAMRKFFMQNMNLTSPHLQCQLLDHRASKDSKQQSCTKLCSFLFGSIPNMLIFSSTGVLIHFNYLSNVLFRSVKLIFPVNLIMVLLEHLSSIFSNEKCWLRQLKPAWKHLLRKHFPLIPDRANHGAGQKDHLAWASSSKEISNIDAID